MFRKILLSALISFGFISAFAQHSVRSYLPDENGHIRETVADFEHLFLDLKFDTQKGKVFGKATHTFMSLRNGTDSLFLDGPSITFNEVIVDEQKAKFKQSSDGVTIYFDKPLSAGKKYKIFIDYVATPKKGLYFIGWNDPTNRSRKQIWTQGEGTDNRHWIPCHDDFYDKLITEVQVTFPSKYKVLSNGAKTQEKVIGQDRVWRYKMPQPHSIYLVMLGIGEYNIHEETSKGGVKCIMYYYPDQADRLKPTYRYTTEIMDFLENETGVKYPWGTYAQIPVQDFLYGAMENTSATIFGDFFNVDERMYKEKNYVSVNAHEMAHQWFGNIITCRSPKDMWVNESFATHYNKTTEKFLFGEEYNQWQRRSEQIQAIGASKRDLYPIVHTQGGSARNYPKGSFVIDMIKYIVGEDGYKRTITHYLNQNRFKNVETYNLQIAFHDVLGYNLDWFFDQWVYRGGEPKYTINYQNFPKDGQILIEVTQTHKQSETVRLFKMPIIVEVYFKDGTMKEVKEWVETQSHQYKIAYEPNKEVDYILFDPNNRILKEVEFSKPYEMLVAQALKAPNMIDRYDAIVGLKKYQADKKRETLIKVYNQEKFHGIKSEILTQLIEDNNTQSQEIILKGMRDSDLKVRQSIAKSVKDIKKFRFILEFENFLTDESYGTIEMALEKLCEGFPEKADGYLQKTDKMVGMDASLRITWLSLSIAKNGYQVTANTEKYYKELVDLSSESYEFRTRNNAFEALLKLNYLNDNEYLKNLANALLSKNGRLKGPISNRIDKYKDFTVNRNTLRKYFNTEIEGKMSKEDTSELKKYFLGD